MRPMAGELSGRAVVVTVMYLISKLPRPARAHWWSYVILVAVAVYFGFWFINFATDQITGDPLVTF